MEPLTATTEPSVIVVTKKSKIPKYIFIFLLLLIVVYGVRMIQRNFYAQSSDIAVTEGVDSIVSISPSGKYILLLDEEYHNIENFISYKPVLKNLLTGEVSTLQELPERFNYRKDGWSLDEKYFSEEIKTKANSNCLDYVPEWAITQTYLESQKHFCTNPYLILDPSFTSKNDGFETVVKAEYGNIEQSSCAGCLSKEVTENTIIKIKEYLGGEEEPGVLDMSGYSIGISGKAYYAKVESGKEDSLYVFDPVTMTEDKIFTIKSNRDTCIGGVSVSPDETKVTFVVQHGCGFATIDKLHVFDLLKNKDIDLGTQDIKGSPVWSPDSKSFYFMEYGKGRVMLKKMTIR